MTPDSLALAEIHLWFVLFSACLAAVATYDLLYVISAAWSRSRRSRRLVRLETEAKARAQQDWEARMATLEDRKELGK